MSASRALPKLRARLTLLTTLLCVAALMVLGAAMILVQSELTRESAREDIEYALSSSNATLESNMAQITRVVRELRNSAAFDGFWLGQSAALDGAQASLEYSADLYSDQNRVADNGPFLSSVAIFNASDMLSCAYYPATRQAAQTAAAEALARKDAFLASGEERLVFAEDESLHIFTRLYGQSMEALGVALFEVSVPSVRACYATLAKYEGAAFSLDAPDGSALLREGEQAEDAIARTVALPFGIRATALVPGDQVARLTRSALVSLLTTLLLLLPVIALLASSLAYRLTRPLRDVADKISRVEAGDYATKLELPKWEEFHNIEVRFNAMTDTIRHLVTEVYEKHLLARESELKFLQSQMNPHFMYNVLAMISMTAKRNGDEETYLLLRSFSRLSRGRIFTDAQRMIPLRQELELVDYYLYLQCKRYEDRITYHIACDEAYRELLVPRLCIEPIAENAFLHGLEPLGRGHVEIRVERTDDRLLVRVTDDGVGFRSDKHQEGVGIQNTRKILQNEFGPQYGVTLVSELDKGTTAEIVLPAEGGGRACGE